ncbi:MAG: ABC transporter permease subunit [Planctomycetes bacterium]|nr:ABC transporter permease subunit [Planctomycetota bacterium]
MMLNKNIKPYVLTLPALTIIIFGLASPIFYMIRLSTLKPPNEIGFYTPGTFTLENFQILFNGIGPVTLIKTIIFAIEVSSLSVIFGFIFCLLIRKLSMLWQVIFLTALLITKLVSPLTIIFGLQKILGDYGPINELLIYFKICNGPVELMRNHTGALLAEIYFTAPITTLIVYLQLTEINTNHEIVAKGLGASNFQIFRRIILPLSYPGIITTWRIVFIWGLGSFLGPLFLGNPSESTISCEIFHQFFEVGNWPVGATWGIILTTISLIIPEILTTLINYIRMYVSK